MSGHRIEGGVKRFSSLIFYGVWFYRVLGLLGSSLSGVTFVRGHIFKGHIFQGSQFSGVTFFRGQVFQESCLQESGYQESDFYGVRFLWGQVWLVSRYIIFQI